MTPKMTLRREDRTTEPEVALAMSHVSPALPHKDEDRMHVFWRVFGGAIISIVALIAVTLYNGVQTSFAELRAEVTKLNDQRADWVRKDEFNTRTSSSYERISMLQNQHNLQNATLVSLKSELESLKEKLTACSADLKQVRDESQRVRADLDRNQIADGERKARRDELQKEMEKALKDLSAAVQACQVKLAHLEGQQAAPAKKEPRESP